MKKRFQPKHNPISKKTIRLSLMCGIGLLTFLHPGNSLPLNASTPSTRGAGSKPNIIIVLTDDQGYGDFSFSGNPSLKTPNIDMLWESGIHFTDFHVAPMCTPTRGQLMTGRDALHNGAFLVCSGYSSIYPDVPTMPEILKEAGYETGLFGKWHLGDSYPHRPMDRGFNTAVWHKGWGISSVPDYWNNDYFNDYYWRNNTLEQFNGYCTDIWFDEAMKWMKNCHQKGEPFFTYISTNAPHAPLFVDDKYREPYKDLNRPLATYFGMIANIDENMGRLDAMLEASGLKNNTILIFMTDNGGTVGVSYYNAGMRGRKRSLYEGGHRVPCILQWPERNFQGEINEMIQVQDVLPTLLDLTGIKTRHKFDGASFAGLLRGNDSKEISSRMTVVQYGNQPYLSLEIPMKYDACVMWDKWRLVNHKELYDIRKDPGQKTDMAQKNPEVVKAMQAHYEKWWKDVEKPVYNKFTYVHIGSSREPETVLTSHDWLTMNTANQTNIRQGRNRAGAWRILAEEEGIYDIRLYRWPIESGLKLNEKAPEYQAVDGRYPEGMALPVHRANLEVGIQEYTTAVDQNDYYAGFEIFLPKGKNLLKATFYNEKLDQLCGAYYVHIKKK